MAEFWRFAGVGYFPKLTRDPAKAGTVAVQGVDLFQHVWALHMDYRMVPHPQVPGRKLRAALRTIPSLDPSPTFAAVTLENEGVAIYLPATEGELGAFRAEPPRREGYWRQTRAEDSQMPWPAPDPDWAGQATFLRALDDVERRADRFAYRGMSLCRLCGCRNGFEDLTFDLWTWPGGFRHYLADHHVRPSPAFEAFILAAAGAPPL